MTLEEHRLVYVTDGNRHVQIYPKLPSVKVFCSFNQGRVNTSKKYIYIYVSYVSMLFGQEDLGGDAAFQQTF